MTPTLAGLAALLKEDVVVPKLFFQPKAGLQGLVLRSFRGTEWISRPFRFELDLRLNPGHSPLDGLGPKLIDRSLTFGLDFGLKGKRPFHGIVEQVAHSFDRGGPRIQLVVGPALDRLAFRSGFRGFEGLNTPEIVKKVLGDAGIGDVVSRLRRKYSSHEYVEMHDESEFRFVSRLLESEGIAYHFLHEPNKHTLVLTDDNAGFLEKSSAQEVKFPGIDREAGSGSGIDSWHVSWNPRTTSYSIDGRDPTQADGDLSVQLGSKGVGQITGSKSFVWSDGLTHRDGARDVARVTSGREETGSTESHGSGSVPWFAAGQAFFVNAETARGTYLLTAVSHSCSEGGNRVPASYTNSFSALPVAIDYLPPRRTASPTVSGPVLAVVAGPDGREGPSIHADKLGRVRVQYHWDKSPSSGQPGTCWARLSQGWSGPNKTGSMVLPLVGQEVVVEFENANPNLPMVTGSVYNSIHEPPFAITGPHATLGFRSPSTGDTTGERITSIQIDTESGHEQLSISVPNVLSIEAKGTVYDRASKDRHVETIGDRAESVGGIGSFSFAKKLLIKVGENLLTKVLGDLATTVGGLFALKARVIQIGAERTIELNAPGGFKIIGPKKSFIEMTQGGDLIIKSSGKVKINGSETAGSAASHPEVPNAPLPQFPSNKHP